MKIFKKFLEYSRFSTGDFEKIFKGLEVPPCPQVVTTLLQKLSDPDIEIDQIVPVLESDSALALQILKISNSALYGLSQKVTSISKAVSLIGLKEIQNIAIGYAMTKSLKDPHRPEFNFPNFWNETILRAIFAKLVAERLEIEAEEAFSASLLQNIAIPLLMDRWYELYKGVYKRWLEGQGLLHELEDKILSWNHAQAGAWVAKDWELPDIFVCAIGLHHAEISEIKRLGLENTSVMPVVISSHLTNMKDHKNSLKLLLETCKGLLAPKETLSIVNESMELVDEISHAMGIGQ